MKIRSIQFVCVVVACAILACAEKGESKIEEPPATQAAAAAKQVDATGDTADAANASAASKFGDWGMTCPEAGEGEAEAAADCRLIQSAVVNVEAKDGEGTRAHRVMLTIVGFVADQDEPVLSVIVPLGVLLTPGVVLEAEGYDKLRMPLQRCDGNGCLAVLQMKEQLVEAFRKGGEAHVTFFNVQGKPNKVRLSLAGFADGLVALQAQGRP